MSIWRRLWSEEEADLARRVLATPEDALSRRVVLGMAGLKWAEESPGFCSSDAVQG